jgi:TRAP-type mannitol/chloroaromatic compound transport system permease large subunit
MGHIYRGIIPFVCLQMMALALCLAYPEIVLWLPRSFGFLD